jgi:hypothetical protein
MCDKDKTIELLVSQLNSVIEDSNKYRTAGCNLAEASIRVINNYDGIHRLSLATSEWLKVVADEGGRNKKE